MDFAALDRVEVTDAELPPEVVASYRNFMSKPEAMRREGLAWCDLPDWNYHYCRTKIAMQKAGFI